MGIRKSRTVEERSPEHRYVVFDTRVGRYKPGIYLLRCTFAKGGVFVQKEATSIQAVWVPRSVTFETRPKAEAYLAGMGPLMWCCTREDRRGGRARGFDIFQAHVKERVSTRYYGANRMNTIVVRPRAKEPEKDVFGIRFFATAREARSQAREWLEEDLKATEATAKEALDTAKRLRAFKNRLGRRP